MTEESREYIESFIAVLQRMERKLKPWSEVDDESKDLLARTIASLERQVSQSSGDRSPKC